MAACTQADKIARFKCQFRIFVVMFDVVNSRRLSEPSVPFTFDTKILVSPENCFPHRLPLPCLTELFLSHAASPRIQRAPGNGEPDALKYSARRRKKRAAQRVAAALPEKLVLLCSFAPSLFLV